MKIFIRIRQFYESGLIAPVLVLLYLAVAGVFFYIADWPSGNIENLLIRWVPWNLRADFFLLLIGVVLCRRDIMGAIGGLFRNRNEAREKRRWNYQGILLVVLILATFAMVIFVAPCIHRIYYDEDIYAGMGQAIAETGRTGLCTFGTFEYGDYTPNWLSYYKEPSGWPFLLSLVFQLFGTGEPQAFLLNNVIFASGVAVVFFIVRAIAGGFFPAFMAALAFTLVPHNLIWSNTMAAEPSAAFFAGLVVLCTAVYIRTGRPRHLFITAAVLPLACQMRAESGLILLWFLLATLITSKGNREVADRDSLLVAGGGGGTIWHRREVWTMGLLAMILLLPHFLHFIAVGGQSWGAEGAKFSVDYFWNNLAVNGPYYLNNGGFPVLLSALALIGLVFSRTDLKFRLLMAVWFFLFWGVLLFFYAGSYHYGADVRFALVTFMPLSVLAGLGSERVRSWAESIGHAFGASKGTTADAIDRNPMKGKSVGILIGLVLLFTWLPFLPMIRMIGQEAWGARYDHLYAVEFIKKIPDRSIVLTHVPTLFLVRGQSAIQADAGIHHPGLIRSLMQKYNGHVYFHYNFWCNIDSEPNRTLCGAIRERYNLEEIASGREQHYEYGLYKMSFKK